MVPVPHLSPPQRAWGPQPMVFFRLLDPMGGCVAGQRSLDPPQCLVWGRPFQNVSEYVGQDACGAQSWNVLDVELPLSSEQAPGVALLNLRPWTQYAIFVRAITLTTAEEGRNYGAQSEVVYIRTMPAGKRLARGSGMPVVVHPKTDRTPSCLPSPDGAPGRHLHVQLLLPHRGALEAAHAAQRQHHLLPGAVAAAGRGHGALCQRLLPQR